MSFDPFANGWRKLLKNGGVGYTEKKVIVNHDGLYDDIGGNDSFNENGLQYVRIGDYIDPHTIYEFVFSMNGENHTVSKPYMTIIEEADGFSIVCDSSLVGGDGLVRVIYCLNENNSHDSLGGTYVFAFTPKQGVSKITVETVHTIDQKYLGGAVLPCVTLTTMPTAEGVALTAAESEQFEKAGATGLPVVLTHVTNDGGLSIVLCNAGGFLFDGQGNGYKYAVANASLLGFGDGWVVMREEVSI